ncbi:ferrochelatase [Streptomyces alboflavus]|uniref:Ferrochelatase n=1 Tax=Streptomyces alboflavus TaxID=67267 RepID=A0A1Z1WKM2_9ACTN|nr:ferrochelatase [Streptomyces alboflavus]
MSEALDPTPYDALLLLSFGGPEGPDDVVPFLENVTRGRGIPKERLKEVGQHYFLFGGVSPINDQNRTLLDALRKDFADHGLDLPVYWGNRNWAPYLTDTLRELVQDGRRRVLVLATSAYASYSGCRQYREDLAAALATLRDEGLAVPRVDKLRHYFNHPGFVRPMIDGVLKSLADLPEDVRDGAHLAFTTHSIPTAAADTSGPAETHGDGGAYVRQHLDVAALIADAVRAETGVDRPWQLVYQSRSGAPTSPGSSPTSATTWRSGTRPVPRPWSWSRSASCRTTWRSCTTSTPRPRRRPRSSACRCAARPPSAPTPGSPPPSANWSWSVPPPRAGAR